MPTQQPTAIAARPATRPFWDRTSARCRSPARRLHSSVATIRKEGHRQSRARPHTVNLVVTGVQKGAQAMVLKKLGSMFMITLVALAALVQPIAAPATFAAQGNDFVKPAGPE